MLKTSLECELRQLAPQRPKKSSYNHGDQNETANDGRVPLPRPRILIAIQIYAGFEDQAQAGRMIIENQNASYRFALHLTWNRSRDDRENSLSP